MVDIMSVKKRKLARQSQSSSSRKKHQRSKPSTSSSRYVEVAAQKLPWTRTPGATIELGSDDEGGMLELEEVDDVDVVWEERPDGSKVVRFKVSMQDFIDHRRTC